MRDFFSRSLLSQASSSNSLIARIRSNFHEALSLGRWKMTSANGAPLHLLKFDNSPHASRAQGVSFLTHAMMIAAVALIAIHPFQPPGPAKDGATKVLPPLKFPAHFFDPRSGTAPDAGAGSGGGGVPIPATAGNLVPVASIQLVRPSLPPKEEIHMPVPPSILDPTATPILTPVDKIGLPWMKDDTDSPGPGDSNTVGNSNGQTMGDGPGDGPGGRGVSNSRYVAGGTPAKCAYCPDPQYTDEAREARLQGAVTLLALVGADGRAEQVRIVKGIGLGLDDRAVQTIRTWKFVPARDAAHHAVPTWITIEAVFRLF